MRDVRALRRRCGLLLFLSAALIASGCSDGTGADPYVGFYDMIRFNGDDLPATDGELLIRSGVLELRSGNRFRLEMDADLFRDGVWKANPILDAGNFAVTGGFITLYTDPIPLTGAIFPTYIRIDDTSSPSVWTRR